MNTRLWQWMVAGLVCIWVASVSWAGCYWYTGTCARSQGASCGTITVCPTNVSDALPPWACGWATLSTNQQSKFCYTYKNAVALSCNGSHPGFKRIEICVVSSEPLAPICCWVPASAQPEYDYNNAHVVYMLEGERCGGGCPTTGH